MIVGVESVGRIDVEKAEGAVTFRPPFADADREPGRVQQIQNLLDAQEPSVVTELQVAPPFLELAAIANVSASLADSNHVLSHRWTAVDRDELTDDMECLAGRDLRNVGLA